MRFVSLKRALIPRGVKKAEFRLDLFERIDLEKIRTVLENKETELLLTLRSKKMDCEYEEKILELLQLKPHFLDLDAKAPPAFIRKVLKEYPETKLILSLHTQEPINLIDAYKNLSQYNASFYKIAFFPKTATEALRALLVAKSCPKLHVICMGETMQFARILSPGLQYVAENKEKRTAEGQLTLEEMELYLPVNEKTNVYALIGNPVDKSQGHLFHNRAFKAKGINALYLKIGLTQEELPTFFPLARALGFKGFSVTMPLKEAVLPFVTNFDPDAKKIKALNTLLLSETEIYGTNTDAEALVVPIKKRLSLYGKRVILLGAGGGAHAAAYTLTESGATLLILNRRLEKAQKLAELYGARYGTLSDMEDSDVLINCTPSLQPVDLTTISSSTLVMDMNYRSKKTPFLVEAEKRGASIISGEEMFQIQAELQQRLFCHAL